MQPNRQGEIAVIFTSRRTQDDDAGYAAAAEAMDALASTQPGYRGIVTTRGVDGFGITISYWADEHSAKAWRDHPDHARIRDTGRDRWYCDYSVTVAQVMRSYDWTRSGG